ncbi:MAG: hypothetical protein FWH31_03665 [Streptococcaceae bacterium]|nr:hypothetical protein [Streptococcaceae bacterium]
MKTLKFGKKGRKKHFAFKSMLCLMIVSILPFVNFSILYQDVGQGKVSQATVEKIFKPRVAIAQTITPTAAPARPSLPTTPMVSAASPTTFGYQQSISSLLSTAQKTQIVLLRSLNGATATVYKTYSIASSSLNAATGQIYTDNNANYDYILYIGGNVTAPAYWNSQFSNGSNNFEALNKRAKSITLISNPADPLTSTNSQATGTNYTLTFPKGTNVDTNTEPEIYFGCNTVFRNLTFTSSTATTAGTAFNTAGAGKVSLYAQGNKFAMAGGAWCLSTLNLVGGSKNSDVNWQSTDGNVNHGAGQAGTNLWVASTGNCGTQILAGMDSTNNTLTGDAHATIVGFGSGGINWYEGSNAGTINGSVYNDIRVTTGSGNIQNIWGGGNAATINGNVVTTVNNSVPIGLDTFYGTFNSSGTDKVTGTVYNTITGKGTWYDGQGYYVGGGRYGTIGTSGTTTDAISNNFDTSGFTSGDAIFVGGDDRAYAGAGQGTGLSSGIIYGNVTNYVKTGFTTGRIISLTGVFGMHFNGLYGPSSGISTNTSYTYSPTQAEVNSFINGTSSAQADANVAASSDGKVGAMFGNAYTWVQGGVVSVPTVGSALEDTTAAYTRGGGFLGYIKGNTTVELGTSNGSTVGGSGMVTAAGWSSGDASTGTNAYTETQNPNLSNVSGYRVFGGGGTGSRGPLGYFQTGQATVIQNNVAAYGIYGGNYGGILNGSSLNVVNAGITNTSAGGGYLDAAQLGNAELDVYNGQVDSQAIAAGQSTMGMVGNAQASLASGSYINGSAYGYVGIGGSVLKGNTVVSVVDADLTGSPASGSKVITGGAYNGSVKGNTDLEFSMSSSAKTKALPSGTVLSGTGVLTATGGVGSGTTNSTTVNITTGQTGLLNNNVMIYGDASTGANTTLGSNTITVNAAGNAMTGKILSTAYNFSSLTSPTGLTGLSQTTAININALSSVASVSAGGDNDNFTNSMPLNGNTATINVGDGTNALTISANKMTSFTQFNLNKNVALTLNNAGLLNGGTTATAANHGASYSTFGNATLNDGSNLILPKTTVLASLAKLTVSGIATYTSPYTLNTGQFNLSGYSANTGSALTWNPTGTAPVLNDTSTSTTNLSQFISDYKNQNGVDLSNLFTNNPSNQSSYYQNGYYQGKQLGYPVLTFTGATALMGNQGINEPGLAGVVQTTSNSNFLSSATVNGQTLYGDIDTGTIANTEVAVMSPQGAAYQVVPTQFDFGVYQTNFSSPIMTTAIYKRASTTDADMQTYNTIFSKWSNGSQLNVQMTTPLTNTTNSASKLTGDVGYNGAKGNYTDISNQQTVQGYAGFGYDNLSKDDAWANANGAGTTGKGMYLHVTPGTAIAGQYQGTMTWSYQISPTSP